MSLQSLRKRFRLSASISLHFQLLPEYISDDELKEYLSSLALDKNSQPQLGKASIISLSTALGRIACVAFFVSGIK